MIYLKKLTEHKLAVFLIAATAVGIICLAVFGAGRRSASAAERIAGDAASVPQGFVSSVGSFFGSISDYFGSVKSLREENERLKTENNNLQKQINDSKGLQSENDELKKMLGLKRTQTDLNMIAAAVGAKDPTNWYASFTIDKGKNDGIAEDQPVVNSNRELVGRIGRVGDNWAEVVSVIDPQVSLGGTVKRSNAVGVVEGDAELRYENKCRFGYLSRDTDITSGDYIETSGLGGIYPKGLIIGVVEDVYDDSTTMSRAATVKVCADFSKLNEVFVVVSYKTADLSDSEVTTGESKKSAELASGSKSKSTSGNASSDDEDDYDDEDYDEDE